MIYLILISVFVLLFLNKNELKRDEISRSKWSAFVYGDNKEITKKHVF